MDLISVIIPIYNSSKYIRDCITSVLGQTYTYFEVLLIDDGSTDDSRDICHMLCAQDERLRLVCREHAGVSAARNAGIEEAKGEYLFFLDSDDVIHPQLLEALHGLMKEKGAAVGTQRRRVEEESAGDLREWETEDVAALENIYLRNEKALECRTFASSQTALSGIGGKMILAEAIVGVVRFEESLTHGEDTLFMYQVLAGGADVAVLCRDWYCYRKHGEGTINKLTVRGCASIYKAECRIRDQETANAREENAAVWELAIINTLIGWYKTGMKDKNAELVRCVKCMADSEQEREIFFRLNRQKRLEFVMLTFGYPFFKMYKLYPFIAFPGVCYRKILNWIHIHRWRVRRFFRRIITFPGRCYRKVLNQVHIHRWRVRRFFRRIIAFPGRCYRKILNQVHIHRWRVRWAYKSIKWKAVWIGQMTWSIIRRCIWKMTDIGHFIIHWKEHFDEKQER